MTDREYNLAHDLINTERYEQDKKWGEQNHNPLVWMSILMEEVGELAKEVNDSNFNPTIRRPNLKTELVQTAAVAMAMVECGVRNGWDGFPEQDVIFEEEPF